MKRDPHSEREARKYANPIASREFILALMEDIGAPASFKLGAPGEDSQQVVAALEYLQDVSLGNETAKGDKVIVHVTNIEQTRDELHGFAINSYNINVVIDPGETKTVTFTANKSGVYAYYCTNFCSALHQEMQGYILVK